MSHPTPPPHPDHLATAIRQAVHGPVWHGPALNECLATVTAEQAATAPIPGAHSIWQLVLHLTFWADRVTHQLSGATAPEVDPRLNFPVVTDPSETEWEAAKTRLVATHAVLAHAVATMTPERLVMEVPEGNYPMWVMARGVVEHAAYHGGQISLLRRALRIEPPTS